MQRLLIAGYYGYGNVGDELILSSMLCGFRAQNPDYTFTVLSGDPAHTKAQYNVESISWDDFPALVQAIRAADLCLLGGGGLIQDYWGIGGEQLLTPAATGLGRYLSVPFLANLFGKPVVWFAIGVGPLFTDEAKEFVRLAASLCVRISVRNERSRDNLERLFVDEPESAPQVFVTADPGFLYETPASRTAMADSVLGALVPDCPVLGVNVRYWGFDADPDVYPQEIANALDRYIQREGAQVLFIPFQSKTGTLFEDDAAIHRRVHEQMTAQAHAHLVNVDLQPDEVAYLIQRSDCCLGMRYHALLLALLADIPAVGLAYDPKVRSLFEGAGQDELLLQPDDWRSDAIYDCLIAAPGTFAGEEVARMVQMKRALAREDISRLCRLAEGEGEPRQVSPEVIAFLLQQRDDLLEHVKALEGRMARLEGEKKAPEDVAEELEEAIAERDTRVFRLEESLATVQQQLSGLRAQDEDIRASKGWRGLSATWRLIWTIRSYYASFSVKIRNRFNLHSHQSLTRLVGSKAWFRFLVATSRQPEFTHRQVTLFVEPDSDFLPEYQPRRILPKKIDGSRKVSLVVVGKNEEKSVERWFASLHRQERLPDELICVDNGSSDRTLELMQSRADESLYECKVVPNVDGTLAYCRNYGVGLASNEIVAMTDFGSELKEDWLKYIATPFEMDLSHDVVSGLYQVANNNLVIKGMIPGVNSVDPLRFLPAAISIAFTKEIWEEVGGFPEWLTHAGEDTYFDLRLLRANAHWALVPDAQVIWEAPTSLRGLWKKLYGWASGDGESGAFYKEYLNTMLVGVRYALSLLLGLVLSILAILLPSNFLVSLTVLYLLVLVVVLTTVTIRLKNQRKAILSFLAGRVARVLGFLSGFRHRPTILKRQFRDIAGVVILMSGIPMDDTGGGSRSAQMAKEYLRQGYLVVYLNKFPKNENIDLMLETFHPNLFQFSVNDFDWRNFSYLFAPLLESKRVIGLVQFPVREYLAISKELKKHAGVIVYDVIDNWDSSLGAGWYRQGIEERIVNIADHVIVSAAELEGYLKKLSPHKPVLELPNAVNTSLFNRKQDFTRPNDLEDCEFIITYVGALWGEWFDWDLLWKICEAYPSASVVLIGDEKLPKTTLPPNLKIIGLKPQAVLPRYLAFSDVAIIPWKVDEITKYTSPLKIYEYIAMGLNVVAPGLETIEGLPGVFCADGDEEFIKLIRKVKDIPIDEKSLVVFLRENSWENRISRLNSHIESGTWIA